MKNLLSMLLVCGLTMMVIATAVFVLDDTKTLVAPPEAVTEAFVRTLVAGRYSRATPHLSTRLANETDETRLRDFAKQIKSGVKEILDVRGEPVFVERSLARSVAIIKTDKGERRVKLQLVREHGAWSIDNFNDLPGDQFLSE